MIGGMGQKSVFFSLEFDWPCIGPLQMGQKAQTRRPTSTSTVKKFRYVLNPNETRRPKLSRFDTSACAPAPPRCVSCIVVLDGLTPLQAAEVSVKGGERERERVTRQNGTKEEVWSMRRSTIQVQVSHLSPTLVCTRHTLSLSLSRSLGFHVDSVIFHFFVMDVLYKDWFFVGLAVVHCCASRNTKVK